MMYTRQANKHIRPPKIKAKLNPNQPDINGAINMPKALAMAPINTSNWPR